MSASSFSGQSLPSDVCKFRTVNYITHTLPQQCLRSSRTAGVPTSSGLNSMSVDLSLSNNEATSTSATSEISSVMAFNVTTTESKFVPTSIQESTNMPAISSDDPFLDNPTFLSFEEWKAQNLANAGQSTDDLESRRRSADMTGQSHRSFRQQQDQSLDQLGDDLEIEIDFFGRGPDTEDASEYMSSNRRGSEGQENEAKATQGRLQDAGKTSKERFNYASFDCGATILKTNPESRTSSAILIENKDTYMRNPCSVSNKFVVIELCEDILVDTVVLANYEFFSSMIRTFRVSVSDRYPVKLSSWKTLDEFEARNSREVQPFMVRNPLIWARYLG